MKLIRRIASTGAVLAVAAAALALPTGAAAHTNGASHPVFVQTGNVAGNQVVAYDRAPNGTLTLDHTYNTGGLGGALTGAVVDLTASQGSLTYDATNGLLYAVNAGSNTVSVFAVRGDKLALRQVISSRGDFPVSVTAKNDVVYVLNARSGANVAGFRVFAGRLFAIPGSVRPLGLDPAATPEFTHTPGQVGFTPDGSKLIVTTKGNTSSIDVFDVRFGGRLSNDPVVNEEPGAVPFAFDFDRRGNLAVTEAGTNSVTTYSLAHSGVLTKLDTVATAQAATCWITHAAGTFYVSNAGSGSVTGVKIAPDGGLTLLANTATDAGTVDADATPDGKYLYVQTGKNGIVDAYRVAADGSLTQVGSTTVAASIGGEGIVVL
jgi:6-phosphogluconolactonase (cycloisomerase 2 family)